MWEGRFHVYVALPDGTEKRRERTKIAVDEQLITKNPGRKIELPSKRLAKPCGRLDTLEEVRRLLSAARAISIREHLIVRCSSSAGYALRSCLCCGWTISRPESCVSTKRARKQRKARRAWLQFRNIGDGYHRTVERAPNDLLFPIEACTPFRVGNYLKRVLKPIAKNAGITDVTFQALRRTFATRFQRYGSPKNVVHPA